MEEIGITRRSFKEIFREAADRNLKVTYRRKVSGEKDEPLWMSEEIRKEKAKRRRLNKINGGERGRCCLGSLTRAKEKVKVMLYYKKHERRKENRENDQHAEGRRKEKISRDTNAVERKRRGVRC